MAGYPLLAYTIGAAQACPEIDRIIVSTDDLGIAAVARQYGAESLLRPESISGDDASLALATGHVLHHLHTHEDYRPTVKIVMLPTYPFRDVTKLTRTVRAVKSGRYSAGVFRHPLELPHRLFFFLQDGAPHPIRFKQRKKAWTLASTSVNCNRFHPYFDPLQVVPDRLASDVVDPYWRRIFNLGIRIGPQWFTEIGFIETIDIDTPVDLQFARHVLDQGLFDPWYLSWRVGPA